MYAKYFDYYRSKKKPPPLVHPLAGASPKRLFATALAVSYAQKHSFNSRTTGAVRMLELCVP